jgi:hypothetical protein
MDRKDMAFVKIYTTIRPRNFPKKDERGPTPAMRAYAEAQDQQRFGIIDEICKMGKVMEANTNDSLSSESAKLYNYTY